MTVKLDGPIPGSSLTREPGNAPWEQPPLYPESERALAWHLNNIGKPEKMDDMLFLLDQGMPLSTFVDSMTTIGVMEGYHTVDASTLIQPVIHQYIKELATTSGINLKEWDGPTEEEKAASKYKERLGLVLGNKLSQPEQPEMPAPMPTEMPQQTGMIKRRT